MPVTYDRDDVRRLITVTVTEPFTLDEILRGIDRQASEHTWDYAMLSDLRAVTNVATVFHGLGQLVDRVRTAGGGRQRGPVGIVIVPRPDDYRAGLKYSQLTAGEVDVEVLLTAKQLQGWLMRHGGGAVPPPSD